MNKNKIIFLAVCAIILLLAFVLFVILKADKSGPISQNSLQIWTVGHSNEKFSSLLEEFKEERPEIGKLNVIHRDFNEFNDYQTALHYAIINGTGPDIFMLNNNEDFFLSDRVAGIGPEYVDPEQFRKNFLPIFTEDLVESYLDETGTSIDFLVGVPAGFETLGLLYDRRSFLGQDLKSWSGITGAIEDLKEKNSRTVPLGIGHGTTVLGSADIFAQFLVSYGSKGVASNERATIKRAITAYQGYGEEDGENGYNALVEQLEGSSRNNLALFSSGEIKMLIGYPSMIGKIDQSGFSKNFLSAEPFPKLVGTDDKLLLNYNYFVIDKESSYIDAASLFLAYLSSDEGVGDYYEKFTERIPAHAILKSSLDKKINEKFNITYKDFLRDGAELVSYNKGLTQQFDILVPQALDTDDSSVDKIEVLFDYLSCKRTNISNDSFGSLNCKLY